jgi:hypothetical protein
MSYTDLPSTEVVPATDAVAAPRAETPASENESEATPARRSTIAPMSGYNIAA